MKRNSAVEAEGKERGEFLVFSFKFLVSELGDSKLWRSWWKVQRLGDAGVVKSTRAVSWAWVRAVASQRS